MKGKNCVLLYHLNVSVKENLYQRFHSAQKKIEWIILVSIHLFVTYLKFYIDPRIAWEDWDTMPILKLRDSGERQTVIPTT